jgi:hypothetical protein
MKLPSVRTKLLAAFSAALAEPPVRFEGGRRFILTIRDCWKQAAELRQQIEAKGAAPCTGPVTTGYITKANQEVEALARQLDDLTKKRTTPATPRPTAPPPPPPAPLPKGVTPALIEEYFAADAYRRGIMVSSSSNWALADHLRPALVKQLEALKGEKQNAFYTEHRAVLRPKL